MLTIYDWHGNYGHPDHIKVHQVGCRAEEMVAADLPGLRVFEATMNRDEIKRQMAMAREAGEEFGPDADFDPDGPMDDGNPMGMTEDELTLVVDVSDFVRSKHAAISCPRKPGDRRRLLHWHAGRGVRIRVRPGVVHRARPSTWSAAGLVVRGRVIPVR